MNLTDFLIVYLACGAPFGVHFFLQRRAARDRKNLWLKTALAFVFWIPLFFLTIRKIKNTKWFSVSNFNKESSGKTEFAARLSAAQKYLESFLSEHDSPISLFEFRRTVERYANLTILYGDAIDEPGEFEKEIFRAAEIADVEIAAVCLHRRNRRRLAAHQIEARKDFLQTIETLHGAIGDQKNFEKAISEFILLINDSLALEMVGKSFAAQSQLNENTRVRHQESKVLWKPPTLEPLHIKTARKSIGRLTTMPGLRSKD